MKIKIIILLNLLFVILVKTHAQEASNNTGNLRILSGATVTMFGDFTNSSALTVESGATLTNNGTFTLGAGSIANSGTYVYGNSAGLTYAGASAQTIGAELPLTNGPPTCTINNVIGVILGNDGIFKDLVFATGNLTIGSNTLTLNGNYSRTAGNLVLNGSSNIIIAGSGALSNSLFFDQTVLGTTNNINNFTINRSGQTITLGNTLIVTGAVIPTTGTIATGGLLTLLSNVTSTARIAALGANADVTGNVLCQRYIPASARRFRFLSSPINGNTLEDWRGEIFITGAGTGNTLGTTNSNGFDATISNAPTVYFYTETMGGALNQRWETPTSTSYNLVQGKGYRFFVRGDRSSIGRLDGTETTQNAVTLISTGAINKGNITPISLPLTYSGATVNDGWNMVGNPYPSQIDWNAASGWTKTNVSGTIWIWNSATNSYGNWDGTTATNSVTQYIASHQGFFVRSTAALPIVSCSELVKVANAPAALFKAPVSNQLRIQLVQDAINSDETVIRFMTNKKDAYDENEDVKKLNNPTVNVSSTFNNNLYASVNYLSENLDKKIVPISVWGNVAGTYQMNFSDMESFTNKAKIYLLDKYLNTQQDLIEQPRYEFNITEDANSKGDNRFEIQFFKSTIGVTELLSNSISKIVIYPVPVTEVLGIHLISGKGENCSWKIFSLNGKQLDVGNNNFSENKEFNVDINELSHGIYFIAFSGSNTNQVIKFTK